MSDEGVFAVHRGVFDHPMFAPESYTEREAWLWMISTAVWKATRVRAGRKMVALDRGQLVFSERFLAEKWGWSKTTVRRFLDRLRNDAMISLIADRDATRITVCNYEKYAFNGTDKKTTRGPPADHSRTKEEEVNNSTKEDSEANASGADAPIDPSIAEREFFQRGRQVLGKNAGGQLAKLKASRGHNVALARAAIETAATKQNPAEYIAAMIRGPPAVRAATVHQQKHAEGKAVLDALHEFNTGSSSREDSGILRHDPGDGTESLCGRTGGNLIELSPGRDRSRG